MIPLLGTEWFRVCGGDLKPQWQDLLSLSPLCIADATRQAASLDVETKIERCSAQSLRSNLFQFCPDSIFDVLFFD
jgi:hypothetical protein